MRLEQAARQALEALEDAMVYCDSFYPIDTLTALRKALEQPDEIDWIETNKALAKEIIELQKQAEQRSDSERMEPVAVVEITYGRKPECYVTGNIDDFPEGVFKLYAYPVRTKDLTDDEIYPLYNEPSCDREAIEFARAVIAADRRKNK